MTAHDIRQEQTSAATLTGVADPWTGEQLLEAVQARVRRGLDDIGQMPMDATLDGTDLLVSFRWPGEPDPLAVRFSALEAPVGPSTGEICHSPSEWAHEIGRVLEEELDTGLVHRGRRSVISHGVVELHCCPALD